MEQNNNKLQQEQKEKGQNMKKQSKPQYLPSKLIVAGEKDI